MKTIIVFAMFVGSTLGGYLPVLWGGSLLSGTSIILGTVGGLLGIWAGYEIAVLIGLE